MKKFYTVFLTILFAGATFAQQMTKNQKTKQLYQTNRERVSTFAVKNTIISADFEDGLLPGGWTLSQADGSDGWLVGSDLGSSYWPVPDHTIYAASNDDACDCDMSEDYIITREMNLTSYANAVLSFDAFYQGTYGSLAFVKYSTNGTHWSTLYELVPADEWQTILINLEDYMTNETFYIGFHHNDQGVWADGFAIDNVLIYEPATLDASLESIDLADYVVAGDVDLVGTFMNMGSDPITSVDVNYSIDGGATQTYTVSGINVGFLETYQFTHGTAMNIPTPDPYDVTIWLTNPNGSTDLNLLNDTLYKTFTGVSSLVDKKVFGEEATGTWCPWCVRGIVFMDSMALKYPETWIGVAVHNGDPMVVNEYDNALGNFIPGYPSGLVDRAGVYDPSEFETAYLDMINKVSPAGVEIANINYDGSKSEITFDVKATFVTNMTGDFRLNAIIVEDSVTGTGSQWNQANAYSGGGYGPMGGYEDLPNPVPAADMVYDHVARALLGGWDGTAESIPAAINADDVFTATYTVVVEDEWNLDKLELIGFIVDQNTGIVVNAAKFGFDIAEPETFNITFNVDMTEAADFDAANDTVYIAGSMAGWVSPGSDETLIMSDDDADMIYSVTLAMEAGEAEYKYFKNAGWGGGEWEGGDNRLIDVIEDTEVNNIWGDITDEVSLFEIAKSVTLYPNPAKDVLFVESELDIQQVAIYNSLGMLVLQSDNSKSGINISELSTGFYFVKLKTDDFNISKRIAISR